MELVLRSMVLSNVKDYKSVRATVPSAIRDPLELKPGDGIERHIKQVDGDLENLVRRGPPP